MSAGLGIPLQLLNPLKPQYRLNEAKIRLCLVVCLFVSVITLIILSIISFQIDVKSPQYQHLVKSAIGKERKEIFDRQGVLLATNLAVNSIYAIPNKVIDAKETGKKLAKIFPELKSKNLESVLSNKSKQFYYIKRNITPKEMLLVNNLGLPGIEFESATKRIYPHGKVLSHLLGYVDADNNGIAGFEYYLDQQHANKTKVEQHELALNIAVQHSVHQHLTKAMSKYHTQGAAGLVMDINSGEIISLVSLPDFDPHFPNKATKSQLFNNMTLASYEPGSIFKTMTMAMALENDITLDHTVDTSQPIKVGNYLLRDYRGMLARSKSTMAEIFMRSSNIGTAKIAGEIGTDYQKTFVKNLGLDQAIKLELPELGTTNFPNDQQWGKISTYTISYGHGFAVTPLHIAKATAQLLNGGYEVQPTLLKRSDISKKDQENPIISDKTCYYVKKLLRLAVAKGTASQSNIPGWNVGAKTGTSIKVVDGKYDRRKNINSYVGAFPISNPKYLVMVILDQPNLTGSTYDLMASKSVVPVAGNIITEIAPMLLPKESLQIDPTIDDFDESWFIEAKANTI